MSSVAARRPSAGWRAIPGIPLVADDGATMVGSLFLVEAPDRDHVVRFNAADPFARAGIWKAVTITGFIRRQG